MHRPWIGKKTCAINVSGIVEKNTTFLTLFLKGAIIIIFAHGEFVAQVIYDCISKICKDRFFQGTYIQFERRKKWSDTVELDDTKVQAYYSTL